MRGLGLTRIDETYFTAPTVITEPAPTPTPVIDYYTQPQPVRKPYGIRLPYFRNVGAPGGGVTTAVYRPENDPMCVLQPSGVYKCVRANGAIETYPGPSYPVTTAAPDITTPKVSDTGPLGLSGSTFKLILLGGLAYLILKK